MKKNIRFNVFETNSSSVHSLCICTEEKFDAWKKGEIYYDYWNDEFTKNSINKWNEDNQTYEDFFEESWGYLETYEEHFTTPSGDKMVAFGRYGRDG